MDNTEDYNIDTNNKNSLQDTISLKNSDKNIYKSKNIFLDKKKK